VPNAILNNPNWFRTVEKLDSLQEFQGPPLAAAYTLAANPILPGQVMVLVNGEFRLADQALAGGAFFGLMYSEFSLALDETDNKTTPPVVLRGPGTAYVHESVLTTPPALALNAGDVVELVAVAGKLAIRGAQTGPTVAFLNLVLDDKIEISLRAPAAA